MSTEGDLTADACQNLGGLDRASEPIQSQQQERFPAEPAGDGWLAAMGIRAEGEGRTKEKEERRGAGT